MTDEHTSLNDAVGAAGKSWFRYRLRTVLLVLTVVAVLLAAWRIRPSPILQVRVTSDGTAEIHEKEVPIGSLDALFRHERRVRRLWWMKGKVTILHTYPGAPPEHIQQIESLLQDAGFEEIVKLDIRSVGLSTKSD